MSYSWIPYLSATLLHRVCHQIKRHFHRAEGPKVSRSPPIKQCHPKTTFQAHTTPRSDLACFESPVSHKRASRLYFGHLGIIRLTQHGRHASLPALTGYRRANRRGCRQSPCLHEASAKFSACLSPDATGASLPTTVHQHTASWAQQVCAEAGVVDGR